jgi:YfiH family protein
MSNSKAAHLMHHSEPLQLRYPSIFSGFPQLAAAESTRHGGVSEAPFDRLNLGLHTDDLPRAVAENRRRFFAACGFTPKQTAGSHQIHGAAVLEVTQAGYFAGYDALITRRPKILLTVTIADCTPVLLFDPVQNAVAAIHAGWKGTAAGIVAHTLLAMQKAFQTQPSDCLAYIGTCIDHCDFEVDADVGDHFEEVHKEWNEAAGKFLIDLKGSNRDQLIAAGIRADRIQRSPYSTVSYPSDYFSHRREKGKTGRMLAAIGLRS